MEDTIASLKKPSSPNRLPRPGPGPAATRLKTLCIPFPPKLAFPFFSSLSPLVQAAILPHVSHSKTTNRNSTATITTATMREATLFFHSRFYPRTASRQATKEKILSNGHDLWLCSLTISSSLPRDETRNPKKTSKVSGPSATLGFEIARAWFSVKRGRRTLVCTSVHAFGGVSRIVEISGCSCSSANSPPPSGRRSKCEPPIVCTKNTARDAERGRTR